MALRSTNTQIESLTKILQLITETKMFADADIPWLIQLETMILQKVRDEPIAGMTGAPQTPTPGAGGNPIAGPQQAGGAPNPGEFQRLMNSLPGR